jgi:Cu(I)/Ag(I) efflux system membrane fusion protein
MDHEHTTHYTSDELTNDEGGLRAPPGLSGWRKAWWWFDFIILVKLARLRFIAVLVLIGAIITQWDTLAAYYDKWTRPAHEESAAESDTEYFCPMHPSVVRADNREKCPICFMPLSKRKKGETHEDALPAGIVNRVQLSPYRVVLAGVDTQPVSYQPLTKEIVAVGYVEFNERGQRTVSARVNGRIDKLLVSETGQMVSEGDVLASLYSPDLNVTVQNLLEGRHSGNKDYEKSARIRLQKLGISDDQIDDILSSDTGNSHLKIRSPISGHVIKKYVREGQYVQEGMPLYDVADLSTVWIQAQVFEDDMQFLPADQAHKSSAPRATDIKVIAKTRAFPHDPFEGSLAFVFPHVDQASRTVTIRCEVANPDHKLRPGETASVTLKIPARKVAAVSSRIESGSDAQAMLNDGKVLAVPESAVIDTGSQTIVYRQAEPNVFEGVIVELGPRMAGEHGLSFLPVLKGLNAGDRIVTSGSFLVDAETRLNPAAGSIYFGGSSGGKTGGSVTSVRPTTPEDTDEKIKSALAKLSPEDRRIANEQKFCPVLPENRLGSMGVPVRLVIEGKTIFVCCAGCKKQAIAEGPLTLSKIEKLKAGIPLQESPNDRSEVSPDKDQERDIAEALAELPAEDQILARAQRYCPVIKDNRLGKMGVPFRIEINGTTLFLCCSGCKDEALAHPQETLREVTRLRQPNSPTAK